MRGLSLLVTFLSLLSAPHCQAFATSIARHSESNLRKYYNRAHSLGEDYAFDPREWQSVNVTNLSYKYDKPALDRRASSSKSAGGTVAHLINDVWNGLKGIGSTEDVKITW